MSISEACIVPNCGNTIHNSPHKIFLSVPKGDRRRNWFAAIEACTGVALKLVKRRFYRICEDHFDLENDSENWMEYKMIMGRILLKKNVVPHIFHTTPTKKQSSQMTSLEKKRKLELIEQLEKKRKLEFNEQLDKGKKKSKTVQHSKQKRTKNKTLFPQAKTDYFKMDSLFSQVEGVEIDVQEQPSTAPLSVTNELITITEDIFAEPLCVPSTSHETEPKTILIHHHEEPSTTESSHLQANKRTSSAKSNTSVSESSETFKGMISVYETSTSLVNHQSSDGEKDETAVKAGFNTNLCNMQKYSSLCLGLSRPVFYIVKLISEQAKVPPIRVIITLKKIRLNDPFFRIAVDFNIPEASINKIYKTTLPLIATFLKQFICWPPKDNILTKLPIQFEKRRKQVWSIIDCFEVHIAKPSNTAFDALTWSAHKKCNTVKYLISSTPNGFVNFVSRGYEGCTSDMTVVKDCKYLEALPSECYVMADRGFKELSETLTTKKCQLVDFASVMADQQLEKNVLEEKTYFSFHPHVERVFRRIREFNTINLHSALNIDQVHTIDRLLYVVCGLMNLQEMLSHTM